MEDESEVSDQESTRLEQHVSAEQTYLVMLRGVRSFMGWKQVPGFGLMMIFCCYPDSGKWQVLS